MPDKYLPIIIGVQGWRNYTTDRGNGTTSGPMKNFFYRIDITERRRLLADKGFVRDEHKVWTHPDGRAIGEGVAFALADEAFFYFLGVELPEIEIIEVGGE